MKAFIKISFAIVLTLVISTTSIFADSVPVEKISGDGFQVEISQITEPDNSLVYDLVFAGPESVSAVIARRFMIEMSSRRTDTSFSKVFLAYKGDRRYYISGDDIRVLSKGFRLGDMQAFHTLMRLPAIVRNSEGHRPFKNWNGSSISVLTARSDDFNKMLGHWYLADLVRQLKQ